MTVETLKDVLLWCLIIDYVVLLWWFFFFVFAHGWMYRMHSRWFKLSQESFDMIHYTGMAAFKLFIFVFNLAPYVALRIADG